MPEFNTSRRRFLVGAPVAAGALARPFDLAGQISSSAAIEKRPGLSGRIDAIYAPFDKPHTPGGIAVLIASGEILHLKGYGCANREFDVRWTQDTRYRMASVTKSFTAAALLALEEKGLVRLDDPLRNYLPDFPDLGAPLTLHHLVTMRSGLWQDETLLGLAALRGDMKLDDMYELVKRQRKFNFTPGSATTYIDSNFRILARVIATVTKKSYWDAMQDLVFRPLGMKASFVAPDINRYYENQAPTYLTEEGVPNPNILAVPFQASGDGSSILTMRDMIQWLQHLRKDYRNPNSLFARMTAPVHVANGRLAYYRRGIYVRQHAGLMGWAHGGFTGTEYVFWPDLDLILANFSNNLGIVSKTDMSNRLTDAFLQEEKVSSRAASARSESKPLLFSKEEIERLTGVFVDPENGYLLESGRQDQPAAGAAGISKFRFEFLGSETQVAKTAAGHFETPETYWNHQISVEIAPCKDCPHPDLMVRHADWPAPRRFVRAAAPERLNVKAQDYIGHYRSGQLGICYSVIRSQKGLDLLVGAGVQENQILHLTPRAPDAFQARSSDREFKDLFALGTVSVKFKRDAGGRVSGMRLSVNRVRDLDFERTA